MKRVFSIYFSHLGLYPYFFASLALFIYFYFSQKLLAYSPSFLLLLIAPFYEWLLHKYVLHGRSPEESEKKIKYMNRLHRDHHKYPTKIDLLFAPLSAGFSIPIQFFLVGFVFTQSLDIALYLAMVTLIYFLFYEWIHLAHHVDSYRPITKWGKNLKQAHLLHHYKNENYWWGVTSSFGDKVLNTYPDPKTIQKSITVNEIVPKEFNRD